MPRLAPSTPLFWWSGRRAASPPVAPAAAGKARPVVGTVQPAIWWARQRGSSPGPPAASQGFPRPWLGLSWPALVWNNFLPRVGGGTTEVPPAYVAGSVYPNAMAASSRFAGGGADPWASTSSAAATADPSAASSRKPGNRP